MINNPNYETRRILNFPAIRPCPSVSIPTLVSSLLDLSHSICAFKSKPLFTNKNNAKTTIRFIQTLSFLLPEIEDSRSLSELHFTFQKINFLLDDCARQDSRVWLLFNSDKASSHFRDFVGEIASALDAFPPPGLGISDDAAELAGFVRNQALKSKFDFEIDDRGAARTLLRAIDLFEIGIAPRPRDLKRVLDYLGIQTWSDCNGEIRFLETLSGQERGPVETSSLIAFLVYCRCTVFDCVGVLKNNTPANISVVDSEIIRFLNADDFRCPISLEIMTDPVTISTGHTFDQVSIAKWFGSGNKTCPVTGQGLISVDVIPNLALKRIIMQYCRTNGIPFPESGGNFRKLTKSSARRYPSSFAAEKSMVILADFLVGKLVAGEVEEQTKAAYEIQLLTKTSIFNSSCLVEANAIPPLLNMLRSENPDTQENSMAGLLNLSKHAKSKKIVFENRGLDFIVEVLNRGVKLESRRHAAGTLFYLASIEEYRKTIGGIPGSITGLISLIWSGSGRAKRNSLAAILGLLTYPENHRRFLSGGLVPMLVNVLTIASEREETVTGALAVLATLAENPEGSMAVIGAGGLLVIMEALGSSYSSRGTKEYCVSLLLALCIHDRAGVVPVLVKDTSLMPGLYSVLAAGSSKKASSLIRILHEFVEKTSSSGLRMGSGYDREHSVYVW